jgi:intein/homing endonuclease
MAIVERVDHEELYLYEILRNPVLAIEFINNLDLTERDPKFELSQYQKEFAADFNSYESLCAARAVGKCLDSRAKIINPITGEYKTVKEWFENGRLESIISIDSNWKQKISKPIIEPNGYKTCIEINTTKGFKTIVTEEHPLLTNRGFVKASELKINDFIAVANNIPYFGKEDLPEEEIIALAHFIAEGTYHSGSITTIDLEIIKDIYNIAKYFNCTVSKDKITYHITKKLKSFSIVGHHNNAYLNFLMQHGIRDRHSYDKFIPDSIFKLPKKSLGLFLNRLFSDDGWVIKKSHEVGYATTSEQLARDVQHLLLRFGIVSSLGFKTNKCRGSWWISIKGYENIKKYCENIGFCINRKILILKELLEISISYDNQSDIFPITNFKRYLKRKPNENYNRNIQYYPSRKTSVNILNKDKEFSKFENADIYWVQVKSLEILENRETYAIEVSNTNTHLVDNIYSHNTVTLSGLITWLLVFNVFRNEYIVYMVPGKAQLDPVWTNLIRSFKSNSLLRNFLQANAGINSSEFKITLLNQAVLLCRIAGQSGTGQNVIGLHTPWVCVDEAGYFPWQVFMEMQPIMNTFTPGFKLIVSGVPTGVRENNVLYHCDQDNSNYTKHRVTAFENPRFTEKDKQFAIEQYGGEDSDDYAHFVKGIHGKPIFSLFDRSMFAISGDPVYKLQLSGLNLSENLSEYVSRIRMFPPIANKNDEIVLGIDLGYTEPTAIVILYLDNSGRMHFHGRIRLDKVSYPIQEKLIDLLDTKYNPIIIGIDRGNAGVSLIHHMMEDDEYRLKNYAKRLTPIDFSSSVSLGINQDGEELKSKTKPFATTVLQDYSNNHKLIYSSTDLEMIAELERMTYTKTPTGDIVYRTLTPKGGKKGEDHFTSALLCGVLAYYLTNDYINARPKTKKLLRPGWIVNNANY